MNHTKIEWVRNPDGTHGFTWNPITGCLGPNGTPEKPSRCPYCFAHKLAKGRLKSQYLGIPPYPDDLTPSLLLPHTDKSDPFVPRFWHHRLREPFWNKKASTIFVCSMGELLNEYYPASWLGNILKSFYETPQHTFLVLTKNPSRSECIHLPRNVWLGVTLNTFNDWLRLYIAKNCQAAKKFISFEPLLNDLGNSTSITLEGIDWIIIGGQSGPQKFYPPESWIRRIEDKALALNIPVFEKSNLRKCPGPLRQEFPKGA